MSKSNDLWIERAEYIGQLESELRGKDLTIGQMANDMATALARQSDLLLEIEELSRNHDIRGGVVEQLRQRIEELESDTKEVQAARFYLREKERLLRDLRGANNQRDAMLTICEELAESACYWSEYDVPLGIVDRLNAAIASVKE